ncbi:MAG: hypothetical protein V1792_02890 [Pseudomonadota bacterium]
MNKILFCVLALLFTALPAFLPAKAIAQAGGSPYWTTTRQMDRSPDANQQTDQRVQAAVTGVDQPDGCLRIRQDSSSSSEIIGCAKMDEILQLSGTYSSDGRWAQLSDNGWVFAAQIDAPNKPRVQRQARRSYESYETYDSEDSYPMTSDSSLWREPATSYGTDTDVVYGSPYGNGPGYGPRSGLGFGFGPVRRDHRGNRHGGNHHGRR